MIIYQHSDTKSFFALTITIVNITIYYPSFIKRNWMQMERMNFIRWFLDFEKIVFFSDKYLKIKKEKPASLEL